MIVVIESPQQAAELAAGWNRLVGADRGRADGIGLMSRCELAIEAWRVYGEGSTLSIHADVDGHGDDQDIGDRLRGLLPCYRQAGGPARGRRLGIVTDIYPGRTGLLAADPRPAVAGALLEHALIADRRWDLFTLGVVAGADSERILCEFADTHGLQTEILQEEVCPYIDFPESWEAYLKSVSRKFRYNVRNREKKLRAAGDVELRCITGADECADFLDTMLDIDRHSWKEEAGTSMTQRPEQAIYHRRIAPLCAEQGLLRCYLLMLDGEAIAYLFGMLDGTIYYNLKSSYREQHRQLSPGVVLKAMIMRELIEQGLRTWDFVGTAEPHKLQWSKDTYTLRRYAVFNRTLRGRLLHGRQRVGHIVRRLRRNGDADG